LEALPSEPAAQAKMVPRPHSEQSSPLGAVVEDALTRISTAGVVVQGAEQASFLQGEWRQRVVVRWLPDSLIFATPADQETEEILIALAVEVVQAVLELTEQIPRQETEVQDICCHQILAVDTLLVVAEAETVFAIIH
jgi:hypothetical protein